LVGAAGFEPATFAL